MSDRKVIAVFGATGNQGGSVINALLQDAEIRKHYRFRGVTRDTSKRASQELAAQGVEMVVADMNSTETARPAVEGAHTVFFVTNFWEGMSAEKEIAQGRHVTDAAKAAGVKHLIFSSLINVSEASNGRLPHVTHFDGKAEIEKYIRACGIPATFVQPGYFMVNLTSAIRNRGDGTFVLSLPIDPNKAQFPLMDVLNDYGKFVKAGIKHFPASSGRTIYAAGSYYTPNELLKEFSEVMGVETAFQKIDDDTFKSFMTPKVAQELLENMLLLEEPGYFGGADLAESLALLDEAPCTWKDFVKANKDCWL
ncbi:unnamed protein product [Clonostachys rosea]|uniref:NmrA-like domain-containing protein n=1 Tax=Bionectria ochroleuca TaxID=29856 RepID=A0ABY6UCV5_BIOOC|nr:unnamed protein product [Clonostachys rosea]